MASSIRPSSVLLTAADYVISGRARTGEHAAPADAPLIVAIHGGTYTSIYFDVPGYSLLDRAAALGIPALAIDRPGYLESSPFSPEDATIELNAKRLDEAIGHLWEKFGNGGPGIVVIGHSIGGAITVDIAARRPKWPLLGIAVSGVGLEVATGSGEAWASLPKIPMVELPSELKDGVMFGPAWTFNADMPVSSHAADAPVPRAELIDITSTWGKRVRSLAANVAVPVHYRQAQFDRLWIVDEEQVKNFAAAFSGAPQVDARLFASAGHCIDFHRLGRAFQLDQLAFALRCAVKPE
jgi:pimeloyl-ACP methyl ester carboxylesterase